ncbi:hypothetical protein FXO38_12403 [Capsicum annuum]|nr:hypothetical protein FXO38_12403 [Capsicum annuum]KAF3684694.1 hypothetical protein FXO37_01233 [Capsicum annuum]
MEQGEVWKFLLALIECTTSIFGLVNYAIVFVDGNLFKIQLLKTRKRLELLLEDLPCDHDPWDYYETSDQLLEPLLLCYDSLMKPDYSWIYQRNIDSRMGEAENEDADDES